MYGFGYSRIRIALSCHFPKVAHHLSTLLKENTIHSHDVIFTVGGEQSYH